MHELSVKEFSQKIAYQLKNLDSLAAKDPNNVVRAKETILSQFIIESLVQDYAKEENIQVTPELLEAEIARYRSNYPDDLSFRKMLAEEGASLSEWRRALQIRLLERLVFARLNRDLAEPSVEEMRAYFESHKDLYKKRERIYLRQIVTEDESKMDVIKKEVKTKDFAALAKKFSITPESRDGGLIGWIERGSVDYFDPLFQAKEGALSDVFKSPFGYHLARVEKKSPAKNLSFEDARPQIILTMKAQKEQAAFKSWLDVQIRKSKVLRNNELIQALNVDTKEKR